METNKLPITGNESFGNLADPEQALAQFYYAFNQCDLKEMSQNWLQSDEIAMDNPLGGIKRGWHDIKSVYNAIFSGPAEVYVEYYDYSIHEGSDVFYAVGRERGTFSNGDKSIDLAIRTSRIFRMIDGVWKQVHHHGSIEGPKLLESYQKAVLAI